MAANTTPIFPGTPIVAAQSFANGDGTTEKTVVTAGTNGTLLQGIVMSSNDTAAHTVTVALNDGTNDHYLGAVAVPASSGYGSTPRVNALATLAPAGSTITLPAGWSLKATMDAAITSGATLTILASGGNY